MSCGLDTMSASLLSSRLINFLRKIDIRVEVLRNKRAEQKVRVSLELCVCVCGFVLQLRESLRVRPAALLRNIIWERLQLKTH
jgi:hypothetical protein